MVKFREDTAGIFWIMLNFESMFFKGFLSKAVKKIRNLSDMKVVTMTCLDFHPESGIIF